MPGPNDTLSSAIRKALTQQIAAPLDPDVKWTGFTSVTSHRHGMPPCGTEPSRRTDRDRGRAKESRRNKQPRWLFGKEKETTTIEWTWCEKCFSAFSFKLNEAIFVQFNMIKRIMCCTDQWDKNYQQWHTHFVEDYNILNRNTQVKCSSVSCKWFTVLHSITTRWKQCNITSIMPTTNNIVLTSLQRQVMSCDEVQQSSMWDSLSCIVFIILSSSMSHPLTWREQR